MHNLEARGISPAVSQIERFAETLNAENWRVAPLLKTITNTNASLKDWHKE